MVVRLGPIFRLGATFIPEGDKDKWQSLPDLQKIYILASFKYPWLLFELSLLGLACIYFTYLRLTIYGVFTNDCSVI
jgi:hypothetical protein